MKVKPMNKSEDPESTRDTREILGRALEDSDSIRESGFERADAPSVTIVAQGSCSTILGSCIASRIAQSFFASKQQCLGVKVTPAWQA